MATDVSIRVGVEGEKEFQAALNGINSQIKNLNSEMKAVVSEMANMDAAESDTSKQTDVLGRSIDATKQKISLLSSEYDRQKAKLQQLGNELDRLQSSQNRDEAAITRATNAYNRQQTVVNKLGTQINNATADLNRMEKEMRDIESGAQQAGNALDKMGDKSNQAGGSLKNAFTAGAVAGFVQNLVSSIISLVEQTEEFRKIMGTLEISSQKAGYSAEETSASYERLYSVIGDDQQSATALANLQALGVSQEQLTQFIDGAIGAWATYGDSIPIDGLAEAINETVQAGTVTGAFADVLSWAGTSEDEFNKKLSECKTESERANLVLQELQNQGLTGVAEGWRENNSAILESNKAQLEMNTSLSKIGETLAPLVATITSGLAKGLEKVQPFIQWIVDNASVVAAGIAAIGAAFVTSGLLNALPNVAKGIDAISLAIKANPIGLIITLIAAAVSALITLWNTNEGFRNAVIGIWEAIKGFFISAWEAIKGVWGSVTGFFQNIWEGIKSAFSSVGSTLGGFFSNAWNTVKSSWENAGTFYQGVWENIKSAFSSVSSTLGGFFSDAWTAVSSVWGNVAGWFSQKWQEIKNAFSDAWNSFLSIGSDIVEGIKQGISDGWNNFVNWVDEKVGGLVDAVKKFLGISSPSKVFRDEVGLMISEGMAEGIESGTSKVIKTANKLNEKLIEEEKRLNSELEEIAKQGAEGQNATTEEKLRSQLNALQTFKSEYESALSEIENKESSMADKLMDYGELFKITDDGDEKVLELGDLEADIEAIKQYGEALKELKERGVSDSLMNEITNMSVDDATAYAGTLLEMPEDKYEEYMALWEEKQHEAQEIAQEFYQTEIDALNDNFVEKIPDELGYMKDEMGNIGINSVQGLIDGMNSKSGELWAAASSIVNGAISAMRQAADINSPSKKTADIIGAPMGEGVAVGLLNSLKKSRASIENAIMQPVNYVNRDDMYNAAAAAVNGMAAVGAAPSQTVIIPVNLNGKQIAEVVFNPLRSVAKQRGVAFG